MECNICHQDFTAKPDRLHYCLCNTSVCVDCVQTLKKSDTTWTCPKCKSENELEGTLLFRGS